EGVSRANFQNALIFLEDKAVVSRRTEKNEKGKTRKLVAPVDASSEANTGLQATIDSLHRYL
ncbi:MAG: hypothetical protein KC609_17130, partial [Myxococcales bacterium]|nr:hypothetical protein [Myxococcales bacterium]